PYLKEQYGNASSIHRYGRMARKAIEKSRKQIASLINAEPSEILITSGGTESNNTVFQGISKNDKSKKIITSSIEHDAILEPCKKLSENGLDIEYLPVNKFGMIEPTELENHISENTCLVSIMFGNNEVGTIQKISELAKICNEHKIPFHTDAVQAVGKIPIDVKKLGIDLLSISSHKLHGPKGIGALYIRKGIQIDPVILGGGQEHGLRSGTENVANIVGFGKACEIAKNDLTQNMEYVTKLRDTLIHKVTDEIPQVTLNGDSNSRLPNNAHFTFLGVNGEDLIIKLDEYGIAASTGSACSVNTQKASHVLESMGFSHEQITGSLRLTLGIFNNESEIEETVKSLKKIVEELRSFSPFKEKYSFT
ncbi:MAG: cysteine desulfurase, partial [Nitrosopumilus sp.]|nr:cysteine desulfurase [Nitrosopumilus sp.]NNL38199.1 cysteine desulfurase [Nitrosopumilus sp.]